MNHVMLLSYRSNFVFALVICFLFPPLNDAFLTAKTSQSRPRTYTPANCRKRSERQLRSKINSSPPRGCAAVPFQKKKVAVVGGGGYLGAITFGFLQRAASLYGTGIGGPGSSIPRCISATATGSEALNRVLSKHFKLAFAGENMVSLTNFDDRESIVSSLKNMDAVVLGTSYQLEKRSVTGNTYEKTPNDKTYELYLDERRGANDELADDHGFHLSLFQRIVDSCASAGVQHAVVIETPKTENPEAYLKILNESNMCFTYIQCKAKWENAKDYTFEKGLSQTFDIQTSSVKQKDFFEKFSPNSNAELGVFFREDIAALAVQTLQSLDWKTSRLMYAKPVRDEKPSRETSALKGRFDKVWCHNSYELEALLSNVQ